MPSFTAIQSRAPAATVDLPVACFADTWEERPTAPVTVGLRTIADADIQAARSQAAKRASLQHPLEGTPDPATMRLWADAFEDAIMRWVIARGTCDPNDVTRPPEIWAAAPEDMVRDALTTDGVGFLYDAWERMRIACDPTGALVEDVELGESLGPLLRERLAAVGAVEKSRAVRARRLLAFVLTDLEVAPPGAEEDDELDAPHAAP